MGHLEEKVSHTIAKYQMLSPGDMVVVGVSGGPDSLALAHLLWRMRGEYGVSLHLAHLNHMFRGAESDADAAFVASFAAETGLPCTIEQVDVPAYIAGRGLSAEAGAREVRYAFFERVAAAVGASKIALGHHADDQVETVLLRVLRGAGLRGLGGMAPVRGDRYIRPFIEVRRAEIEEYCREQGLTPRLDSSNLSPVHLRNRVRQELLPFLRASYNPAVDAGILQMAEIIRAEDAYMSGEAQKLLARLRREPDVSRAGGAGDKGETGGHGLKIDLAGLASQPVAMQRRIIRLAFDEECRGRYNLEFVHVEAVRRLVLRGRTGETVALPGGMAATRGYGALLIGADSYFSGPGESWPPVHPGKAASQAPWPIKIPGRTEIPEMGLVVEATVTPARAGGEPPPPGKGLDREWVAVDLQKVGKQVWVRYRRPGERFWPLGASGTKKLKEFLIDAKVPRSLRDKVPIIAAGPTAEQIVWITGLRIDERVKITSETREVLHLFCCHTPGAML
ncbi:MAG: tRNA lysidine(34) synthetase TilS [Syntrophothermus sp.]